ncbi:SRPBCC domain-containing protein [Dietzia kunjamensis]|uniref:SRPBCC domain-containing protein n=1 Tax=Dietzia kunjamensis TaxID=322509 RepID=UPI0020975678|nr:SRPBCC domain-containing protein [Dietzia kunjamensis]USX45782.1 SRPBCC domain-containing protein [Dietzia kunjamensis]
MSNSTAITVERVIDHSAAEIFEFLSNPENHARLDGSGFVRGDYKSDRIQQVGDVFSMDMEGEHMGGEYRMDNQVTGFGKDKILAWQPAPAGTDPKGWEWVWELKAQGPDSTLVRHTYDWSKVTDKDVLKKVSFPLVSEQQMEDSLSNLASAVSG